MICVSIGRGRHKQVVMEHRHLVDQGAELVELRLDYIRRNVDLRRLITDRPCPVVVSCRREKDGGKWTGSETQRLTLLRAAIADGVDYVDLEEDIADQIPRYGTTKRIISLHDFEETPSDLESIHKRLAALDPDIIKMATMAHNPHDNVRVLRLIDQSEIPMIGITMGEMGIPSRILAGKFGAPFTFATFHHERTLAPGQLSFQQMTDVFRYDQVDAHTEVYGVVADPIGHSLSPAIHNASFREQQMNRVYLPFRVPRESLKTFILEDCQELGVRGLSVTIPHKEAILDLLTDIDPVAEAIGAVNTVLFSGDQRIGYNTDYSAAMASLADAAGHDPDSRWLESERAIVLGAGGAARAISFGLKRCGAEVFISSRTLPRAEQLADWVGGKAIAWDRRHTIDPRVIVNATPVGMHPHVDETPIDPINLTRQVLVFDTVYNPEQTLLVKDARERGCKTVTGVDMFVRQAALQFELFTGASAPEPLMRAEVKRMTGAARS